MEDKLIAYGEIAVKLQSKIAAMLEHDAYEIADIDWVRETIQRIGKLSFMYQSIMLAGLRRIGVDDQMQMLLRGLEEYSAKGMAGHPKQAEAERMVSELRRTWDIMCGRT